VRTAAGIVLGLVSVAVGCGGAAKSEDGTRFSNGDTIAAALEQHLLDKANQPISSAECPNQRLLNGDDIACRVTFSDGSYKDITVTVKNIDANGGVQIEVGVP